MLKDYFKVAFRNLARHKAFSFINIFGLAVGLATCLLIMLYILDETKYDKHHKNVNRIFRVASVTGKGETWAASAAPVAWSLKSELPEVEQVTRLMTFPDIGKMLFTSGHHSKRIQFFESHGYYVDSTFFQLFTYDFIYGNAQTALNRPSTIVISEQVAHKYFGRENPVGRPINITTPFGEFNYTVTGVFNSSKNKSHIPASYFLSMRNNDLWNWVQNQTKWANNNVFFTYVKLKEGTDPHTFEQKLKHFYTRHAGNEMRAAGFSKSLFIQPVKDIYLRSSIGNEIASNGNINYLYILASIGAFILMIACINFMNLSTARSEKRAKEVGVRKVLGAGKSSLVKQFLGESFLMCLMGLAIALVIGWALLPLFNKLSQKNLQPVEEPALVLWIAALTLLAGLIAGIYPALYLSAFKPTSIFKGRLVNGFTATTIRKGLVVFQFTISICLVIGSMVIWQQLKYLQNKNLGFDKTHKIVLPLQQAYNNSQSNYTALKAELLRNPDVISVTSGSTYPGITNLNDMLFYAEGKSIQDIVDVQLSTVESNYPETLGIKLLYGRTFSNESRTDSSAIILNEAAVKELGYEPGSAVGKNVQYDFQNRHLTLQIIGVIQNFNFESLHKEIKPFGFTNTRFGNRFGYVIANLKTSNYSELLLKLEGSWNKILPGSPFTYSFLDEDFQRNYEKEGRTSRIVVYFTIIAILIACLGLFGLAAFSAERRIKEIGIRKVLGASVADVTTLLSKDFIQLVLISIVISAPIAWLAMNKWLQDFEYRIEIKGWIFLVAGALSVVIALVTISSQAISAAVANPLKSLRTE